MDKELFERLGGNHRNGWEEVITIEEGRIGSIVK